MTRTNNATAATAARHARCSTHAVVPLVVLAEDNLELRTLLAAALERVGYRVVQADTGARLVALVDQLVRDGEVVRLVITDVRMPDVGGFDAARSLRAAGHTFPLVFMTAFGDAWTRARAAELGAVLLDKPLSLAVVRQVVERLVG